ncbi:MAG: hypothetical protein NC411_08550 [Bacteroides sp.]|nr:hypothetical protein [Bacteroides sp.]
MSASPSLRASHIITVFLSIVILTGCSGNGITDPVNINRLDLELRDGTIDNPALRHPAEELFRVSGYGELTDSMLVKYSTAAAITIHANAVDSVWNDVRIEDMSNSLGRVRINYRHLFPDRKFPEIYSIVSPFRQSVFTVDSLLYVGLNHYLGSDYEPYGYFPEYQRRLKTPARVATDIAETLVRRDFPYQPAEDYPTTLSRLLYEGAVTEAVMQLAGVSEQEALGYDDEQFKWLGDNEHRLWETIVGGKFLFSTDPQVAASLVNPAPFTSLTGHETPGAAGRFIGHRIVNSYLDSHAVSIAELLSPGFYESQSALADSRYK